MAALYSEKSLGDILRELKRLPFKPRPLGGRASTILGFAPDALPMLLDTRKKTACLLYPYPRGWKKVEFTSRDGTPLAGMLALHGDGRPRPGIVFCHGIFGSKNQNYIRGVAIKAFRDWGYNVLAMDLRGHGESQRLSDAFLTGGWKEAEDIIGAARHLASYSRVTTVGVSGYSLGATSAMIAAALDGGEHITGGVLAWNGFADQERMISYVDRLPLPWQPFFLIWPVFKGCTVLKARGLGADFRTFRQAFAYACEHRYRLSEEEIYRRSSPKNHVAAIEVPTLHVHAADDPVIPLLEAEENRETAAGNPRFQVWVLERGGHCAFSMVDKGWYHRVLQDFFGFWAETP